MTYPISESEKNNILAQYGIKPVRKTLFQTLDECKISIDKKYIMLGDNVYSSQTGELMPLSEQWYDPRTWAKWSTSDILHGVADIASMGVDFIWPGSGAIIDIANAAAYIIEAQFTKDPKKKQSYYLMAMITAAFVVIPGFLQGGSLLLKRFIKGKPITKAMEKPLAAIAKKIDVILDKFPPLLQNLFKSPFGKNARIIKFKVWFSKNWGNLRDALKKPFERFTEVKAFKQAFPSLIKKGRKAVGKVARAVNPLAEKYTKKNWDGVVEGIRRRGAKSVFHKLGIGNGSTYTYLTKGTNKLRRAKILDINQVGVKININGVISTVSHSQFVENAIRAPYLRRTWKSSIPLFVKRFASFISDEGDGIMWNLVDAWDALSPEDTSRESLKAWDEEQTGSQTNKKTPTKITPEISPQTPQKYSSTKAFQLALIKLGYNLPNGGNGVFDKGTQDVIKKFQNDQKLKGRTGRKDRLTAKTLALQLKMRGIKGTEDIQNALTSL